MMMRVDKFTIHNANKSSVLECIATCSPINQAAIAHKVGLSIPSVMKMVDMLESAGIIRRIGKGKSSGGKPPQLLEFISDAYYAVGLDVGRSVLKGAVTDLSGNILFRSALPTGDTKPEGDLIARIGRMILDLIEQSGVEKTKILGVGVGMPGLIDAKTGDVIFSPDFGWKDVPLKSCLSSLMPYPVLIENANISLARGEYRMGAGKGAQTMICVNVAHGIGAGVIIGGKPYYGASGTCGEIGHMTMEKNGPLCTCGNTGCLEALASGEVIAREAVSMLRRGIPSDMLALADGDPEKVDAKIVFDAAKAGDAPALIIVNRAIEYIGTALAGCINLLDPEKIILCGGLTRAGDFFLSRVKEQIRKRQMRFAGRNVSIEVGLLGTDGAALGATQQVLDLFFESGGCPDAPYAPPSLTK